MNITASSLTYVRSTDLPRYDTFLLAASKILLPCPRANLTFLCGTTYRPLQTSNLIEPTVEYFFRFSHSGYGIKFEFRYRNYLLNSVSPISFYFHSFLFRSQRRLNLSSSIAYRYMSKQILTLEAIRRISNIPLERHLWLMNNTKVCI